MSEAKKNYPIGAGACGVSQENIDSQENHPSSSHRTNQVRKEIAIRRMLRRSQVQENVQLFKQKKYQKPKMVNLAEEFRALNLNESSAEAEGTDAVEMKDISCEDNPKNFEVSEMCSKENEYDFMDYEYEFENTDDENKKKRKLF